MNTFRQLLRQPLKLISGILLVSIAVALLCVCLGQSLAADQTKETMEQHFTTIALQTYAHRYEDRVVDTDFGEIQYSAFLKEVPEEIANLINALAAEHPELVQTIANPGLASAYIPALTPDNECYHQYHDPHVGLDESMDAHHQETDSPYADAMLEIVVESVDITYHSFIDGVMEDGTAVSMENHVSVTVTGKIERVLSLEEGWDNPVGRTAVLSLRMPTMAYFESLNLEEGGRYLVSGTNYEDGNWKLKGEIARKLSEDGISADWQAIDTDRIRYLTLKESERYLTNIPMVAIYEHFNGDVTFTEQDMVLHNAITMDVIDRFTDGEYSYIHHETGAYPTMDYTRRITDDSGNKVQITEEEWLERYKVPLITRLDGTAEEFLASDEGELWQQQLDCMEINYHAFPVIGVEKLGHIADFSRENARIVDGRNFTEEELTSGAKVCILSEPLAAANGLAVGDTINPQFYNYDYDNPNQEYLSEGEGVINPCPYKFTATTKWSSTEEYTIIGLYRQNNAWGDVSDNLYSFTPNTIFVPITSVTSDMDYGNQGFFQTLILQNGAVAEFRALVDEAGYDGLFVYYDQEYTTISDTLMNYRAVAQKALIVGIVVYAMILFLFLFFYPGSQGKTLMTMTALGAKRGQKIKQIVLSSSGILLPGSLVGAVLGMLLWDMVISRLADSIRETVTLEMEPPILISIAITQFVLALLLTVLVALPMSKTVGMKKRK